MTGTSLRSAKRVWPIIFTACAFLGPFGVSTADEDATENDPYRERREAMVRDDIAGGKRWGRPPVESEVVLRSMMTVPRHRFVPGPYLNQAYDDHPLAIGYGQTISQPYIVAFMTEFLKLDENAVVLEVGTGSGYQAAVLAEIAKDVYTIEIIKELGEKAAALLKELGYKNVHGRIGDGYFGWEKHAPFDAIIVTAAASHIPPPLIEQLKPGGIMAIPVGPPLLTQTLMLVEKKEDGAIVKRNIMPVRFVPLKRGLK